MSSAVGFRSCVQAFLNRTQNNRSVCLNPRHTFYQKMGRIEFYEKGCKLVTDSVFPFAKIIAESNGASDKTLGHIAKGRELFSATRTGIATMNILRGVFPGLFLQIRESVEILNNLGMHSPPHYIKLPHNATVSNPASVMLDNQEQVSPANLVQVLQFTRIREHNSIADGNSEKMLRLGYLTSSEIGALTYIWCFGPSRYTTYSSQYCGVKLGPVGRGISDSFQYAIAANHASGILKCIFGLFFERAAKNRAVSLGHYNLAQVQKAYNTKKIDYTIEFSEKALEGVIDVFVFTKFTGLQPLRIGIKTVSTLLALVRIWRKDD